MIKPDKFVFNSVIIRSGNSMAVYLPAVARKFNLELGKKVNVTLESLEVE